MSQEDSDWSLSTHITYTNTVSYNLLCIENCASTIILLCFMPICFTVNSLTTEKKKEVKQLTFELTLYILNISIII